MSRNLYYCSNCRNDITSKFKIISILDNYIKYKKGVGLQAGHGNLVLCLNCRNYFILFIPHRNLGIELVGYKTVDKNKVKILGYKINGKKIQTILGS